MIPVLEEMGYGYSHEELAKELGSRVCGIGKDKKINIYLDVNDLNYKPGWDTDTDTKFQELADQIAIRGSHSQTNEMISMQRANDIWDGIVRMDSFPLIF